MKEASPVHALHAMSSCPPHTTTFYSLLCGSESALATRVMPKRGAGVQALAAPPHHIPAQEASHRAMLSEEPGMRSTLLPQHTVVGLAIRVQSYYAQSVGYSSPLSHCWSRRFIVLLHWHRHRTTQLHDAQIRKLTTGHLA